MADEYLEQQLDRVEDKVDRIAKDVLEVLDRVTGSTPTPDEPDDEPDSPAARFPSQLIPALRNWTIMLPTGGEGDPDNDYVVDADVPGFYFVEDGAVVFRCPADGVHSPNSKYPRCEAREMDNDDWDKAAWSSAGPRTLTAELAIDTSHLSARKRINGLQIHDGGDDVLQIMAREDGALGIAHNDGDDFETLVTDYRGERFACSIEVRDHTVRVTASARGTSRTYELPKRGSSWYWKAGCYLQTGGASEHREPAGAYGEVRLYSLDVTT